MLDWEWFTKPKTAHLFMYLILAAKTEDGLWRGEAIEKGQLVISLRQLADKTGLSLQDVRVSLERLQTTGEIIVNGTRNGTLITIVNYAVYQIDTTPQKTLNGTKNNKKVGTPSGTKTTQPINNNIISDISNNTDNNNTENNKSNKQQQETFSNENISEPKGQMNLFGEPIFAISDDYLRFQKWLRENCPYVLKVKTQMSQEEFLKLSKKYTHKEIAEALLDLNNWPKYAQQNNTVYYSVLWKLKRMYGERSSKMG